MYSNNPRQFNIRKLINAIHNTNKIKEQKLYDHLNK